MMDTAAALDREPNVELEASPATITRGRTVLRFGRCQAIPSARALLRCGQPIEIGSRAFDLLMILLHSRGELVSKEAIVRYVWPTTLVDESNLRFQMATLRKALAEERNLIKTVPGRGYVMIAEDPMSTMPFETSLRVDPVKPAMPAGSTIFIVDEDDEVRAALLVLLRPLAARLKSFNSMDALRAEG